jgi:CheY-like chemotaxis protein
VTAYGQDEDRRRSHEAGFEQHLVKPVDPDALQSLLNSGDRPSKARGFAAGGRATLRRLSDTSFGEWTMSEYEWMAKRAKEAGHPQWDRNFWKVLYGKGLLSGNLDTRRAFQMLLSRYSQYMRSKEIGPPINPN